MPSRAFLIIGNLVAITVTLAAFTQALSWTIAGILILASLVLPLLVGITQRGATFAPHTASKTPNASHRTIIDTKTQNNSAEEQSLSTDRALTKGERKSLSRQQATKPWEFGHVSVVPSSRKPQATSAGTNSQTRPAPIVQPPSLNPTIATDDYVEYEVELEEGKEFVGDVTADGLVNVYLLDEENMDNLDEGEEFWSETGEESVENAKLDFTASTKGRWFFVVENADDRAIVATVKLQKGSTSEPA